MRPMVVLTLVLVAADLSWADPVLVTYQSGISTVRIGHVLQADDSDAQTDGRVSVSALWGAANTPEARTAARSAFDEIAVNARIDDKFLFSQTHFSDVLGAANYGIQVAPDPLFVNDAIVDFLLPSAFLEVTSNAEIPLAALSSLFLADLRVCFDVIACSAGDSIFSIQASLTGSHRDFAWNVVAGGHPSLDLTPLETPTIVDDPLGFYRTTRLEFPAFAGHVDLGRVPRNQLMRLEYHMRASATGRGASNVAIAAINDPFVLDTDPVQKGVPLTVTFRPIGPPPQVPEPASATLCATAIAAWLGRRLRRRRGRSNHPDAGQ